MITFRRATPADKAATLSISAHFPDDWLYRGFDEMTAAGCFFVAEERAEIVAVCGYEVTGDVAWLQAMRVDPSCHNRGIATGFTLYLMDQCRRAGLKKARLDTVVDNHPVHRMMEKLGFATRGNFCFDRRDWGPDLLAAGPALDDVVVRSGGPADLEAMAAFFDRRAREGALDPAGLISPPDRGGDVEDFGRSDLAGWLDLGLVLVAGGRAAAGDDSVAAPAGLAGVGISGRIVREVPARGDRPAHRVDQLRVSYLEGEPPVQAALLKAALDAAASGPSAIGASATSPAATPAPPDQAALRLPATQWRTVAPRLRPADEAEKEHFFEAVVYEKHL